MPLHRHICDWTQPLLPAAAAWLLEQPSDQQPLVVVPSARAGRRLRELLAAGHSAQTAAAGGTQGEWLPPHIVTVGHLSERLVPPSKPLAGPLDERAIVAELLLTTADLRHDLWRVEQPTLTGAWRAAKRVLDGIEVVAAAGLTVAEAAERAELASPVYRSLAAIETTLDATLASRACTSRRHHRRTALANQDYAAGDHSVILIGIIDPPPLIGEILAQVAGGKATVTSLVAADPEAEHQAAFDELGRLQSTYWTGADLGLRDEQIIAVASAADQANAVLRLAERVSDGQPLAPEALAMIVPEASDEPALRHQLEAYGLPMRGAVGRPVLTTAPGRVLSAVGDLLRERSGTALLSLARQPSVRKRLPTAPTPAHRQHPPGALVALIDDLREHPGQTIDQLPPDAEHARAVAKRLDLPEARRQAPLAEHGERIAQHLSHLLPDSLAPVSDDAEAVSAIGAALRAVLPAVTACGLSGSGSDLIALLTDALTTASVPEPGGDQRCEALGPLELTTEEAPALALLHACEGTMPDGKLADPFWPDSVRQRLGLACDHQRHARDAYALASAIAQRDPNHLIVVVPRVDHSGQTTVPSRLLFHGDQATRARRARGLFGDQHDRDASGLPAAPHRPALPAAPLDRFIPPLPDAGAAARQPIAVTHLRTYLACPYRFYLKTVLGARQQDPPGPELAANAFGTLIHDTLDHWAQHGASGGDNPDAVADALMASWEQLIAERIGDNPTIAVALQLDEGRRRLTSFAIDQAALWGQGWRIEHTEKRLEQAITLPDGRQVRLHGSVDRIDRHPQHGLRVIDYKTGDAGTTAWKAHVATVAGEPTWVDLQLPAYRELLNEDAELGYLLLPKQRPKDGAWSALAPGKKSLPPAESSRAALQRVLAAILDGVFWPPAEPPRYRDGLDALLADASPSHERQARLQRAAASAS